MKTVVGMFFKKHANQNYHRMLSILLILLEYIKALRLIVLQFATRFQQSQEKPLIGYCNLQQPCASCNTPKLAGRVIWRLSMLLSCLQEIQEKDPCGSKRWLDRALWTNNCLATKAEKPESCRWIFLRGQLQRMYNGIKIAKSWTFYARGILDGECVQLVGTVRILRKLFAEGLLPQISENL